MHPLRAVGIVTFSVAVAAAQVRHWQETATELIWRTVYTNCDKGYSVDLPPGVVAHASHPPNPNHGFLVSASSPGTTIEVSYDQPRVIGVYDDYDAAELGSARAYLEIYLKDIPRMDVLQIQDTSIHGLPAVKARWRERTKDPARLKETLIMYRNRGGLVYHIFLQTTEQHYAEDSALLAKIKAGLRLLPIPKGECSNR